MEERFWQVDDQNEFDTQLNDCLRAIYINGDFRFLDNSDGSLAISCETSDIFKQLSNDGASQFLQCLFVYLLISLFENLLGT